MHLEFLILLIPFGIWLIIDGIYSIIEYWNQTPKEHLIRVIRTAIGALFITLYYLIMRA